MSDQQKTSALELIRRNIAEYGHHSYLVQGGPEPRFAYTIGLRESHGVELVLPGGSLFNAAAVFLIIDRVVERLRAGAPLDSAFDVDDLGTFRLREAHQSWVRLLLLGALDYYRTPEVRAYQIVPDDDHWTVDVPDLREPWDPTLEPAWKWLCEDWPYAVPSGLHATTNMEGLRGGRIARAARWEDDDWELFTASGPDEEPWMVPLGTLLGVDASLARVLDLKIGECLRRDEDREWEPWT